MSDWLVAQVASSYVITASERAAKRGVVQVHHGTHSTRCIAGRQDAHTWPASFRREVVGIVCSR